MRKWLLNWLLIGDMRESLARLKLDTHDIKDEIALIKEGIALHNRALGRIIAKLDPMYGVSEFDPARIATSKRLEDEILLKLKGEYKASNNQ